MQGFPVMTIIPTLMKLTYPLPSENRDEPLRPSFVRSGSIIVLKLMGEKSVHVNSFIFQLKHMYNL